MKLSLRNERENQKVEQRDANDLLSIKIKGHKNGFGSAQMFVSGEIQNNECLKVLSKALHRFEDMTNMKHYLDLGGVESFSYDAALEIISHIDRMSTQRSLYGIVDVSATITKTMSDIGAFNILQRAYIGDYSNHSLFRSIA